MGKFIYRGANQKRVFAWPIVELPHVSCERWVGHGRKRRNAMFVRKGRTRILVRRDIINLSEII